VEASSPEHTRHLTHAPAHNFQRRSSARGNLVNDYEFNVFQLAHELIQISPG
jgi:hypothetical protein